MKISFKKITLSKHQISVSENGDLLLQASLDSFTYFLHDIVHFCVESELNVKDGFWGLVGQGYNLDQISGKENELTLSLRFTEQIVGPVQSIFNGHMPAGLFQETMEQIGFSCDHFHFLDEVLFRIEHIINEWKFLPIGECLELEFNTTEEPSLILQNF
ncbi:MAG: hypothetical protein WC716_02760 [Chitinophagaceae bacterium]|jgi:hypothetical protein